MNYKCEECYIEGGVLEELCLTWKNALILGRNIRFLAMCVNLKLIGQLILCTSLVYKP